MVEALLALLDEGELSPTAERVAERAGVSERSIFQHFGDREALFEAAARRQYERSCRRSTRSTPPFRSISACTRSSSSAPPLRAGEGGPARRAPQGARVRVDRGWLDAARRAKAIEVEKVFAREMAERPTPTRTTIRAAMVAAAAWTSWESLRIQQRLGFERPAPRCATGALAPPWRPR